MNPLLVFARLALLADASLTPQATGIEELWMLVNPACWCVGLDRNVLALVPKVNRITEDNLGAYEFQNNHGSKNRTLTPFAGWTK